MADDRGEAQPGLEHGARVFAGTMFAAVYGELSPHPWRGPDEDQDAYIPFHQRSLAMGWLADTSTTAPTTRRDRRQAAPGLWGMNDAGQDHPLADPAASLVAWFQVAVDAVADDQPLPVQPFLRCAGDVAARIGDLDLQAVQVLLPVQAFDVPSRRAGVPSLPTAGWFEGGDRHSRTSVRVTLDSGQAPSLPAVAPAPARGDEPAGPARVRVRVALRHRP